MRSIYKFILLSVISMGFKSELQKENSLVLIIKCNDKLVRNGYVHFLSNDVLVNDIGIVGWELIEKGCKNCKVQRDGSFKIDLNEVQSHYNKSNKDSIQCVLRCENGLGFFFKIPLKADTINLAFSHTLDNDCFFK